MRWLPSRPRPTSPPAAQATGLRLRSDFPRRPPRQVRSLAGCQWGPPATGAFKNFPGLCGIPSHRIARAAVLKPLARCQCPWDSGLGRAAY
jgi:hypothetical protein